MRVLLGAFLAASLKSYFPQHTRHPSKSAAFRFSNTSHAQELPVSGRDDRCRSEWGLNGQWGHCGQPVRTTCKGGGLLTYVYVCMSVREVEGWEKVAWAFV